MDIRMNLTAAEKAQIREKKLKEIEQGKLEIYGLPKTDEESKILRKAMNELFKYDRTAIVCPRCGNKLILLQTGASAEVKCLNPEICIKTGYRGL